MSDQLIGIYEQHVCMAVFGFTYGGYCNSVVVFLKSRFEALWMAIGLWFLTCGLASIAGPLMTGFIFSMSILR